MRFTELFAYYDRDHSGKLDPRELGSLVSDLMGGQGTAVSVADVAYFVAMLDLDGRWAKEPHAALPCGWVQIRHMRSRMGHGTCVRLCTSCRWRCGPLASGAVRTRHCPCFWCGVHAAAPMV